MPDFKLSYSSVLEKQHAIAHTYEGNRIEDPYVSTYSYRHCFLTKTPKILNKWCWSNWIIAHLEEWDWVLLSVHEWLHSREGPTPWWASPIGLERFFLKKLNFLVGVNIGYWRDWMRCWRRSKYFVRNSQRINKFSVKTLKFVIQSSMWLATARIILPIPVYVAVIDDGLEILPRRGCSPPCCESSFRYQFCSLLTFYIIPHQNLKVFIF